MSGYGISFPLSIIYRVSPDEPRKKKFSAGDP